MISKHHHPHVCPSNGRETDFYYGIFTIKYIWFYNWKTIKLKLKVRIFFKKKFKTSNRSQTVSVTIKFKLTKVLLHLAWLDSPGILTYINLDVKYKIMGQMFSHEKNDQIFDPNEIDTETSVCSAPFH